VTLEELHPDESATKIGDVIELDVTNVANGGFCIARFEGRVVFVRHSLPGERVRAEITEITKKFLRADVIEVVEASEHRVDAPCSYAGTCGGCDWQHASVTYQRELKSAVVREQMSHLAKVESIAGVALADFRVKSLRPVDNGLRWRTRNRYSTIGNLGLGFKMNRSHTVIEIDDCLIAVEGSTQLAQENLKHARGDIETARSSTGQHVVVDQRGGPWLDEKVAHRKWRIHAKSFWQIHEGAPEAFVEVVRSMAGLRPGESLLDLYSGSALFAASLASDVGEKGTVVAVESAIDPVRDARRSCSDLPQLDLVTSDVAKWVKANTEQFDVVVLDPPRAGAGLDVIEAIGKLARRSIIYVACEPSALARDTRVLLDQGWQLDRLEGFDAFPMTSHVECFALFSHPTRK